MGTECLGRARSSRASPVNPELVPASVHGSLSRGEIDTCTFAEQFALDLELLVGTRLPEVSPNSWMADQPIKQTLLQLASLLLAAHSIEGIHSRVAGECDTIRAIGSLAVGTASGTSGPERLEYLRVFARDDHFGVREWCWIGLRHEMGEDVVDLIPHLKSWAQTGSERERRFASEITRPRGVWCRHLRSLKETPWNALGLLELLKADEARYVQISVGNWLSDAYSSQPAWVVSTCDDWMSDGGAATARIVRRALRNRAD
jgi:3-methyladenine DNA glycosylase AlkC